MLNVVANSILQPPNEMRDFFKSEAGYTGGATARPVIQSPERLSSGGQANAQIAQVGQSDESQGRTEAKGRGLRAATKKLTTVDGAPFQKSPTHNVSR